jgi:hypothetical protein
VDNWANRDAAGNISHVFLMAKTSCAAESITVLLSSELSLMILSWPRLSVNSAFTVASIGQIAHLLGAAYSAREIQTQRQLLKMQTLRARRCYNRGLEVREKVVIRPGSVRESVY